MPANPNTPAADAEEQADAPTPETRLTRKPVAERLGVSVFKVRSMEGKELHPEVVGGVHYFDAEEVAVLARALGPGRWRAGGERTEGEIAALAFSAFDEGRDLREIVEELAVPPEKVRALYREWRSPDLEQHEVARRRRERAEAERRREAEEQRQHDEQMRRWEREISRLSK
jgi:hypothetical protein